MRRLAAIAALVLATGVPIVARAGVNDDPSGIVPTKVPLARIRAMYDHATGKDRERTAEVVEEWRLLQDTMHGTFRTRRYLGNYTETTTLGPFTYANGAHGNVRWQQNRNGQTFAFGGLHERDAISDRAFTLVAPDRPEVHVLGESPSAGAYVIEIAPPLGRHEWLFIDKKTGELIRRERVEKNRRYITTYENFRTFESDPMATRIHTVDSLGNERDQQLVSRTIDPTPDVHDFDPPANRRTLVDFAARSGPVRLPARLVDGLFVVRVNIANHGYDFLVDTGAAGIVLDRSLAESLGLERYGSKNGNTLGTYIESTAILQQMSIGTLRMQRVVARVVPLPFRVEGATRIVGLLGFDFFEDVIAHVDFANAAIDVTSPQPVVRAPGTQEVPLLLDDKTPVARMRVDGGVSALVNLDTGANRSIVFASFCDRTAVAYQRLLATANYRAVGGVGSGDLARFRSLELGPITLPEPIAQLSADALGTEDLDGIVGTDLLRALDITFDFRNAAAYVRRPVLKVNARSERGA